MSSDGTAATAAIVGPEQLEALVLQSLEYASTSSDPNATQHHQRANQILLSYDNSENGDGGGFTAALLSLLQHSQQPSVVFYALTTLQRRPWTAPQQYQLRQWLLLSSASSSSSSSASSIISQHVYLRNKAADVLTRLLLSGIPTVWPHARSDLIQLARAAPALYLGTLACFMQALHSGNTAYDVVKTAVKTTAASTPLAADATTSNSSSSDVSIIEQWLQELLNILQQSIRGCVPNNGGGTSQHGAAGADDTTNATLALEALKIYLHWTDTSHWKPENLQLAYDCMYASLPGPTPVQLAVLACWKTWIASITMNTDTVRDNDDAENSMDAEDENGNHATATFAAAALDDDNDAEKAWSTLTTLLERIHQHNLLPYEGESLAEIEVVIAIAQVINEAGEPVILAWEKQQQQQTSTTTTAATTTKSNTTLATLFHEVMDLFFRAFRYSDIDVSAAVLAMAGRIAQSLERDDNSTSPFQAHLAQLLNILYQQLRYPIDFGSDYENDDDAEEQLFRAELSKLYIKLVRAAPATCLQFTQEALYQFISDPSQAPTPDMEACLRLLYHYCEGMRPPPGLKVVMKNAAFVDLVVSLHRSSIARHSHHEVLCLYYETATRYAPVFKQAPHTELLAPVLQAMTGPQGLQHEHARVRSRCCYLLLKLVKAVVAQLALFAETAIGGILGLLDQANSLQLRPDDTLYLFETVGLLVGKTGLDDARQQQYLTKVLQPHVADIQRVLREPNLVKDADFYGDRLATMIAAMAHLSKGFANPSPELRIILAGTLQTTQTVLERLPMSEPVRNKSMVLLQRIIQCGGDLTLPHVPHFLPPLIEHCTSDDVLFVAQLFNQLCIKYKAGAVDVIDTALLPFLRKCHRLIPMATDIVPGNGNDDVPPHLRTEQLAIRKLMYIVLQHVVTHNATAVLTSATNVSSFESCLQIMSDGARQETDPSVRRTCLRFFRELIEQWSSRHDNDLYRQGLMNYVCGTLVPGIVPTLLDPSFDVRDAQQARVVGDLAALLYTIKTSSSASPDYYQQGVVAKTLCAHIGGGLSNEVVEQLAAPVNAKALEVTLLQVLRHQARPPSASNSRPGM